jgi:RES domain
VRGHIDPGTRGTGKVRAPASGLDVRDFPSYMLTADSVVYRIHRAAFGPWWFSSDGSQRFDIPEPGGTCYLAERPIGAFLETLARLSVVLTDDVVTRRLAIIRIGPDLQLADCLNPVAAGFGVTATTSAGYPYSRVSHPWARRFYQAGFDGIRYGAAHHPALAETSYALFGPTDGSNGHGTYTDRYIPDDLLDEARLKFGLVVM